MTRLLAQSHASLEPLQLKVQPVAIRAPKELTHLLRLQPASNVLLESSALLIMLHQRTATRASSLVLARFHALLARQVLFQHRRVNLVLPAIPDTILETKQAPARSALKDTPALMHLPALFNARLVLLLLLGRRAVLHALQAHMHWLKQLRAPSALQDHSAHLFQRRQQSVELVPTRLQEVLHAQLALMENSLRLDPLLAPHATSVQLHRRDLKLAQPVPAVSMH